LLSSGPFPEAPIAEVDMARCALTGQFVLAVGLTLLNGCKPLYNDDAAYFRFAVHLAEHPLNPYGFDFAGQCPANLVLAPPVLLYWWALAIRLFGMQAFLWKLWLLPFNWLLIASLYSLYRHYCRGLEGWLLGLTVLTPAVILNLNLMLDLPAVALALSAQVLFLRACVRRSLAAAVWAGVVAGLAMQTKYTSFLTPVIFLLQAFFLRRLRIGVIAVTAAVLVFAAWEAFVAAQCGASHFLINLHGRGTTVTILCRLALALLTLVGSAAPFTGLLALVALRLPRRRLLLGGLAIGLGYVLLALVPETWATFWRNPESGQPGFGLKQLIFGVFGMTTCWAVARVAATAFPVRAPGVARRARTDQAAPKVFWNCLRRHRVAAFLALWLCLEVAGYFTLAPAPCVRRILRLVIVATLVVGRAIRRQPHRVALVRGIALANALLGLGVHMVDCWDAAAERRAVLRVAGYLHPREGQARVWHSFAWWGGAEFYAEQAGMHSLTEPGTAPPCSGEWLLLASRPYAARWPQGAIARLIDQEWGAPVMQFPVTDALPLRSITCWRSALEHHEGPRLWVRLYRKP
jgi:hypothetical protein